MERQTFNVCLKDRYLRKLSVSSNFSHIIINKGSQPNRIMKMAGEYTTDNIDVMITKE